MKRIIGLFYFCLFSLLAKPQQSVGGRKIIDQTTGSLLYLFQNTDIQGSQFLFDNWMPAKIIRSDESVFDNLMMKFDIYNNKFVFNRNDTLYEAPADIKEVIFYRGIAKTESLLLKNGFSINNQITSKRYLEVLVQGKVGFLKLIKKELEEYSDYGNASKLKRFDEVSQYYISMNGQYKQVSLSKKDLENVSADQWSAVLTYLTNQSLSGKDEKSWIKALSYYNGL